MRFIILLFSFFPLLILSNTCFADEELWTALKEGGKIILMRHMPVDNTGNALHRDASCKKERNLSEAGKEKAQVISKAFNKNNIPHEARPLKNWHLK